MAGLQHPRNNANGGHVQEPQRSPSAEGARPGQSQPLGVILFCRRRRQGRSENAAPDGFDPQEAIRALEELERRVRSRVYRVYACEDTPGARWEYFTVLEFGDLQAWNLFEQDLERNGFGARFDYTVRAFGRRLGHA